MCCLVYTSNFYVTSFIYYSQFTRAIFIWKQKIGDWELRITSKQLPILCVVSSTWTIFCMWQFLFATWKLTRQIFSKYNCHIKIGQFCSSTRVNKNCHIKIARVDGAMNGSEFQNCGSLKAIEMSYVFVVLENKVRWYSLLLLLVEYEWKLDFVWNILFIDLGITIGYGMNT